MLNVIVCNNITFNGGVRKIRLSQKPELSVTSMLIFQVKK